MYNHNKAQQSKNRVHISWDILYAQYINTAYRILVCTIFVNIFQFVIYICVCVCVLLFPVFVYYPRLNLLIFLLDLE